MTDRDLISRDQIALAVLVHRMEGVHRVRPLDHPPEELARRGLPIVEEHARRVAGVGKVTAAKGKKRT